jgi:hypothetical protein
MVSNYISVYFIRNSCYIFRNPFYITFFFYLYLFLITKDILPLSPVFLFFLYLSIINAP